MGDCRISILLERVEQRKLRHVWQKKGTDVPSAAFREDWAVPISTVQCWIAVAGATHQAMLLSNHSTNCCNEKCHVHSTPRKRNTPY